MTKKQTNLKIFTNGLLNENPSLMQLLGLCPTLAVTNALINGIAMGLAVCFVLICSNIFISLLRKLIPNEVRIACYIIIIATFVTTAEIFLKANFMDISKALGPFVPLIVVNCIILGRAEAFASKNSVGKSILDALGMGLGYMLALIIISSIREILGSGTLLGFQVLGNWYTPLMIMILPPGAFFILGFLIAGIRILKKDPKSC